MYVTETEQATDPVSNLPGQCSMHEDGPSTSASPSSMSAMLSGKAVSSTRNTKGKKDSEIVKHGPQHTKKTDKKEKKLIKVESRNYQELCAERLIADLPKFLPRSCVQLVAFQIRVRVKEQQGKDKWTPAQKTSALSLLFTSPEAYKVLADVFSWPSVSTLKGTMHSVGTCPGFSETILEALKQKMTGDRSGKLCVLAFDDVKLKEEAVYNIEQDIIEGLEDFGGMRTRYFANHATVFAVRGILTPWKQVLGYVLSSGPLKEEILKYLLLKCLDKLTNAGLDVKAIVCDQDGNHIKTMGEFGITEDSTYFMHNSKKIFVVYDPRHLLKSIRNDFKRTGFRQEGKCIYWGHIQEFYKVQLACDKSLRLAPHLSDRHIDFPPSPSIPVKLATAVFIYGIAAGISCMTRLGRLTDHAEGGEETAQFICRMARLLNTFSSKHRKSTEAMRQAMSSKSGHTEFLLSTLDWLKSVELWTPSKPVVQTKLSYISGWIISIKSLMGLWEELHGNYGIQYLFSSRLSQDFIEALCSTIKKKCGLRNAPRPSQFREFLWMEMVNSIIDQDKSSDSVDDEDQFLAWIDAMCIPEQAGDSTPHGDDFSSQQPVKGTNLLVDLAVSVPYGISTEEDDLLHYISACVAKTLCDNHTVCVQCQKLLAGPLNSKEKDVPLTNQQLPETEGERSAADPSKVLVDTVQELESIFQQSEGQMYMDKVRERFMIQLTTAGAGDSLVCPAGVCHLKRLTVGLFLIIRFQLTLKDSEGQKVAMSKRCRKTKLGPLQ